MVTHGRGETLSLKSLQLLQIELRVRIKLDYGLSRSSAWSKRERAHERRRTNCAFESIELRPKNADGRPDRRVLHRLLHRRRGNAKLDQRTVSGDVVFRCRDSTADCYLRVGDIGSWGVLDSTSVDFAATRAFLVRLFVGDHDCERKT